MGLGGTLTMRVDGNSDTETAVATQPLLVTQNQFAFYSSYTAKSVFVRSPNGLVPRTEFAPEMTVI